MDILQLPYLPMPRDPTLLCSLRFYLGNQPPLTCVCDRALASYPLPEYMYVWSTGGVLVCAVLLAHCHNYMYT